MASSLRSWMEMRSEGKWKSSGAAFPLLPPPTMAVVDIDECAGDVLFIVGKSLLHTKIHLPEGKRAAGGGEES